MKNSPVQELMAQKALLRTMLPQVLDEVAEDIHCTAINKGWYPPEGRNEGEMIALMHSELSEALEALRSGNPPDDKCPDFSSVEIELADAVIRILDYCQMKGFDLGGAILAKMAFNKTRPIKHGGKKF